MLMNSNSFIRVKNFFSGLTKLQSFFEFVALLSHLHHLVSSYFGPRQQRALSILESSWHLPTTSYMFNPF